MRCAIAAHARPLLPVKRSRGPYATIDVGSRNTYFTILMWKTSSCLTWYFTACNDLFGRVHEINLTKDFESSYLEEMISVNSQGQYSRFDRRKVMESAQSKYNSFIDYQLSLGIPRILLSKEKND